MSVVTLSKDTVVYSIGTLSLRFTAFLLIPLYTRYLTQSEFGLLQILLFTIQFIITINDMGMRSAIMRFYHNYDKNGKISELFGSSLSINILIGTLLLIIALMIPNSLLEKIFDIEQMSRLFFYTFLAGVLQTLSLNILSYFRAKGDGIKYMGISIVGSIILIILTYLFLVVFDLGIAGVLWAQSITFSLIWIYIVILLFFKYGLKFSSKLFNQLIRFGFPLIFAMSGDLIINTSGSYMLGYFSSLEDVAVFSLAYKIAAITLMVLIGPFQMAYEPFVFRNIDKPELPSQIGKITSYIFFAFMILSTGILFIFRDMIYFLGPSEYADSYFYIFYILPGLGATILSYVGQSLLHINNKTGVTGKVIFYSTILSLLISYPMIRMFGIYGLILSLNFYLIFSSAIIFILGNREYHIPFNFKKFFILISVCALVYAIIYFLSFENNIIYYSAVPALLILVITLFYFSNYFPENEKLFLKKYLSSILSKTG